MASNTFSGARAIFLIDSVPIAFAGSMSGEETVDHEPVDVLNNLAVAEHVPVAYRVSLNAQVFRVIGNSVRSLGDGGILPKVEEIIQRPDLTAAVQDSITERTMALFTGVRCSGHSWDVTARGIVSDNINFVAIKVAMEED